MADKAAISYLCPNCSAGLLFDAEKQKFACEFCLSLFDEDELTGLGANTAAEEKVQADEDFSSSMNRYFCENCGAEVAVDEHTTADFCYYCHNPVVLRGKMQGSFKPDKIIPFKYNKEEAEKKFLEFAKKKWFVPRDFFSKGHADKITGIYYPFWVTDADTSAHAQGKATRVRIYMMGDWEITETSKYDIIRDADIHFEDVTTSAFSKAEKRMLEGILPFPPEREVHLDFSMPYLLGYQAKMRDIERAELSDEVRHKMENYSQALLSSTVQGYTTQHFEDVTLKIKHSDWEYTLMPVWVLTYKSKRGKIFTYAMNGHTGKIYGELPLSLPKLFLLGGAVAVVCLLLALVMGVTLL